jgi:agmatine deiminase
MRDANDRPFELIEVPSPGRIDGPDGHPLPCSHLNFYIANRAVLLPAFGGDSDSAALAVIAKLFPDRDARLVSARALLEGGGTLHCVSCHEPQLA